MKTIHLTPFDNIQKTLDQHLNEKITLILDEGIYYEKLYIRNNDLTIIGKDKNKTVISNGDYNYKIHEDGLLYNTFRTSTVDVIGKNVRISHLTIENSAGPAKHNIGQAISLSVYGDGFKASDTILLGHQDTLFIGPLPTDLAERYAHILPIGMRHTNLVEAHFKDCHIEGNVDFIFGSGKAIFDHCQIEVTNIEKEAYVAAPSTYESFSYGFIFKECKIVNTSNHKVYLARPWREHGKTYFLNCEFKGLFVHDRFDTWDKENFDFKEYPYIKTPYSNPLDPNDFNDL